MSKEDTALTPEQSEALTSLADNANQQLETAGQDSATRAFNLGCSVSLLPALALILLAFFLTKGNWVFVFVSALLVLLVIVGVANLASYTAKSRAMDRTFQENIAPKIDHTLSEYHLNRTSFDQLVSELLPESAALRVYITPPPTEEAEASSEPDSN